MIRLGTAGIPISFDGSSIEAIPFIKKLGLQALEVEFVRGVHMSIPIAKELGKIAKENDIALSIHAPYYINLASHEKVKIIDSKKRILDSLERGDAMGARIVVMHPGYYGKHSKEECYKIIKEQCQEIIDKFNGKCLLGLETTAKQAAFGTVEEILQICKDVKGCVPVIDFAHLFARDSKIDYSEVLDKFKGYKHLHCHFSNMKKNKDGSYTDNHVPIDNAPAFEPLAKEILKRKLDITIISESPLIEKDALKMKKIFEKLGYKFIF
ncbi:MAG: TIM barrel protein [Nanoarchaeota archaeon]|nr:TIM barrel protein [Nanoarchaeota archaeon]MBU4124111.1 TIM barrel protein [Nanoarchaeota archaeon]